MDITHEMVEDKSPKELLKEQRRAAAKPMLWIGIASLFMAFAGLISGYIVSRSALLERESWFVFELPTYFYISTVVILTSSVIMFLATKQAQNGDIAKVKSLLWITAILGVSFGVFQLLGWQALHDSGVFFTGEGSNPSGSWVYAITFFHLLHMVAGIIVLFVVAIRAQLGKYANGQILGIQLAAIFWHFLDLVWVILFLFLFFFR